MAKGKMNVFDWLSIVLLVVGGLVHGIEAFGAYPVEMLGIWGSIIKILVAGSGIYTIGRGLYFLFKAL